MMRERGSVIDAQITYIEEVKKLQYDIIYASLEKEIAKEVIKSKTKTSIRK